MSFSEYRGSEQFKKDQEYVANVKKREQELATQKKNDLEASYSDTGGLPKNLRYPYARIEDGMDFLKIQIATYTPPDLNLETLLNVPESKNNPQEVQDHSHLQMQLILILMLEMVVGFSNVQNIQYFYQYQDKYKMQILFHTIAAN
jgi:hypothetical protein